MSTGIPQETQGGQEEAEELEEELMMALMSSSFMCIQKFWSHDLNFCQEMRLKRLVAAVSF